MKFAIVIPLYNKGKYVLDSISSVLNQSHDNFEVIVVNDGSTDDGPEKVKLLMDKRIRIIHQPNLGVSEARNTGIKNTDAEYISFLDADDIMHPEYLSTISGLVKEYSEAGLFCVAYKIKKNKQTIRIAPKTARNVWDYFSFTENGGGLHSSSVTVRRKVFESVGFFRPGFQMAEDLDMWLRIGLKYPLAFSDRICNVWNYTADDSITKTHPPPINSPLMLTYKEQYGRLPSSEDKKLRNYIIGIRNSDVLGYLKLGNKGNALVIIEELKKIFNTKKWDWFIIRILPKRCCIVWYYFHRLLSRLRTIYNFRF